MLAPTASYTLAYMQTQKKWKKYEWNVCCLNQFMHSHLVFIFGVFMLKGKLSFHKGFEVTHTHAHRVHRAHIVRMPVNWTIKSKIDCNGRIWCQNNKTEQKLTRWWFSYKFVFASNKTCDPHNPWRRRRRCERLPNSVLFRLNSFFWNNKTTLRQCYVCTLCMAWCMDMEI